MANDNRTPRDIREMTIGLIVAGIVGIILMTLVG